MDKYYEYIGTNSTSVWLIKSPYPQIFLQEYAYASDIGISLVDLF